MLTKFGEFRSLFSRIFERNFAKFRAKSFTAKRYSKRNFKEISLDISEGQTKKSLFRKLEEAKFHAATNENKLIRKGHRNVSLSGVKHTCKQTKIKPLGGKNVKAVKCSFLDKKKLFIKVSMVRRSR